MTTISEADVEQIALNHLSEFGLQTVYCPDIDRDYAQVIFEDRLRDAVAGLKPDLPYDAPDGAYRQLTQPEGSRLETLNRAVRGMLIWGVEVEHRDSDRVRVAQVQPVRTDKQPRIQKPHLRLRHRNDLLHLQKHAVPEFRFPLAPTEVVQALDASARLIGRRTLYAPEEAQTMTKLRDEALPHLTAGQVAQVPDGPMVGGGDADGC